MKNIVNYLFIFLLWAIGWGCSPLPKQAAPLALHPSNGNYFIFNDKPTILVTSGEHYGSVMNSGFDHEKYLKTLADEGFNYTRIFIGPYSEIGGNNFGITSNTMNPDPNLWLTPWKQDSVSALFDLTQWNQPFFDRLHQFIGLAESKNIVVEVTLFTSFYTDHQWIRSPFYFKNNSNGIDSVHFLKFNTMDNGQLWEVQEKYVRKIVRELNPYGNIFFEIQNEPWSDNPHLAKTIMTDTLTHPYAWQKLVEEANEASTLWQRNIAELIVDEESKLPNRHLIAQNISNYGMVIENPNPAVSIFNFHYAYPDAASENVVLNKVIGLDETGFMPHNDFIYRSEAWKFILSGGALYNNLDYSFTVGNEDGTYLIDNVTPGWGGISYRKQLATLRDFMNGFDFISMKPDKVSFALNGGTLAGHALLSEPDKQYALYLHGGKNCQISLRMGKGNYSLVVVNPVTGEKKGPIELRSESDWVKLPIPSDFEDIAISLVYLKP